MDEQGAKSSGQPRPDPLEIASPSDFGEALTSLRDQAGLSIRGLAEKLKEETGEVVPSSTLGGWFSGSHLPTPKLSTVFEGVLHACGEDDPTVVERWLRALHVVRRPPGPRPGDDASPFRGLAFYEPQHARYFCGRSALSGELCSLVQRAEVESVPVVVVGPSGSGKSSLLRAGMIPRFSDSYDCLVLKPGPRPLDVLAREAANVSSCRIQEFASALAGKPEQFGALLRTVDEADVSAGIRHRGLLVVVDQLEEIFTQCSDESRRRSFVDALCAAVGRPDPADGDGSRPVAVVFGMRADFYARALQIPQLRVGLQRAQLIVGPMSREELAEAITGPAREARLSFEQGLVDLLLEEIAPAGTRRLSAGHEAGALPLLSHALLATYEQATSRRLTLANYRSTGGIHEAISRSAEDAYGRLDTAGQREAARRLFLRLVLTSDDAVPVRRRIRREELSGRGEGTETDEVQRVVDQFIEARLLSADEQSIEITHEALLVAWGRLRGWLEADEVGLRIHRHLAQAAAAWQEAGRDPDLLYRGGALEVARERSAQQAAELRLNEVEQEFLDASLERQHNERQRARRRVRQRNQVVAVLVVLVLAALGVGAYARQVQVTAEHDRENASKENTESLSRFVADEADRLRAKDVPLAMQLALAGYRIAPTAEARSSLLNMSAVAPATRAKPASGAGTAVAVARQGGLVAAGTTGGVVELWRADDAQKLIPVGVAGKAGLAVSTVALADDGKLLVTQRGQATPHLWNLDDPSRPRDLGSLSGYVGAIESFAASADGRLVAAGTDKGDLYIWNLRTSAPPKTLHVPSGRPVTSVSWSPDRQTLAAGTDQGTVVLGHVVDDGVPVLAGSPRGSASRIFSLAFSADGHRLAAGTGAQHDVYVWDVSDAARPVPVGAPLTGPASWVNSVSFSPDGAIVAAGSSDSLLWLFDVATGRPIGQLPHPNPVIGVAFAAPGVVLTLSDEGVVRRWNVPGPVISGARDSIFAVSFDATGTELAVGPGSDGNTLTVWNVKDRLRPTLRTTVVDDPSAGRFSGSGTLTADGRLFVVGCSDGTVQIWNISDPAGPRLAGPPFAASTGQELVESVNLSHDGKLLAVSADDGAVALLALSETGSVHALSRVSPPDAVKFYQAAFSGDGLLLAAVAENGKVYLWDIRDRAHPQLLSVSGGFSAAAYSVAFSPDGRTLAAGSADNTVRLWSVSDPRNPAALGRPVTGPVGYIYSLTFDPTGGTLATGSTDNTVWLWDVSTPSAPRRLATLTGPTQGVLTVAFAPDGRTLAAGGHDRSVRLWTTDPETLASWICSAAGEPISRSEWEKYVPGRPYLPPCP